MDKRDVIRTLKEMGDILEISGANPFEIRAYRYGMRSLEDFDGDLSEAAKAGTLTKIQGIGKGLSAVISDLMTDGRSEEHARLRGLLPDGLPELLTLSGIGPKKVKALWEQLGIESLDDLEKAARAEKVSTLRGFGKKTEERIVASIERRRERRKMAPSVRTRTAKPGAAKKKASARRAVSPAKGGGRVRVGTSGFAYKEWKGSFYPDDLAQTRFLDYYASRLPTVEINNSFYRFPTHNALSNWAEKTPDGFLFAVKANQRITHRLRLKDVEEVTQSFVDRCSVLGERLGPFLFQLPPSFARDDARLDAFLACLPEGGRYALEFRHESWLDDAVLAKLGDAGVALVVHDGEELSTPREVTAPFVYVRLRRDGYDEAALDEWTAWFDEQRAESRDVFAYLKHKTTASPEAVLGRWLDAPARPMAPSVAKRRGTRRKKA